MKINSIPYSHLLAVLRAEEAGKDIVRRPDGVHIYAMDPAGELRELEGGGPLAFRSQP